MYISFYVSCVSSFYTIRICLYLTFVANTALIDDMFNISLYYVLYIIMYKICFIFLFLDACMRNRGMYNSY